MINPMDYIDDIKRYEAGAYLEGFRKIANYCAIALRSRDASLASCSDDAEGNRVRNGFCATKLGMDTATPAASIDTDCTAMKADRNKQRITNYFLLTKNAGGLVNP